jgi:probable F420-dependent oxidoreductase
MSKLGVTLPSLSNTIPEIAEMARLAEDAGFDSVFHWEAYRSPYMGLAAAATKTSRITLATGIAHAFTRTPFATANLAADLDEISSGRAILGLGTGDFEFMASFHDREVAAPLSELREYVEVVRMGWDYLDSEENSPFAGRFYNFTAPILNPFGGRRLLRRRIPIYLAGFRPRAIRLAGEIADGLLGGFWSVRYLSEVVMPNVAAGARRAGRDPATVDVASETICSVCPDRDEALRRARIQVGFYAAHPFSDPIVAVNGLEKEQEKVREAIFSGGFDTLQHTTDDALVEAFSISGNPDECRAKLEQYEAVLPHVVLHTPYCPPLTSEESMDSLRWITEAFAR